MKERRKGDRRKVERRAPKRGVTIRHDDSGYIPKRVRRGGENTPVSKAPAFDAGGYVFCRACGKYHRERATCGTESGNSAADEIRALASRLAAAEARATAAEGRIAKALDRLYDMEGDGTGPLALNKALALYRTEDVEAVRAALLAAAPADTPPGEARDSWWLVERVGQYPPAYLYRDAEPTDGTPTLTYDAWQARRYEEREDAERAANQMRAAHGLNMKAISHGFVLPASPVRETPAPGHGGKDVPYISPSLRPTQLEVDRVLAGLIHRGGLSEIEAALDAYRREKAANDAKEKP